MSKSNYLENGILEAILNGVAITGLVENHSTPLANLYVALHSADPGEAGDQTTNEIAYTNYARVAIARNPGAPAWTVTANSASPTADVEFPLGGAGSSGTFTHFSIGTLASGAGQILYSGTCTNLAFGEAYQPKITTATTITED